MRSKFYLGILAAGLSLTALGAGCGDDVAADDGDGTGGTGNAGVGGTGNTGNDGGFGNTGGVPVGPGGSGGIPDDGNDSCAEAVDVQFGQAVTQDTIDHAADLDFFKIDLMEGQVLVFEVDAKPNDPGMTFADGYIDSVITLYDDADMIVAVNDDPIPRNTQDSTLYIRAPKTGTYCFSIEDFCHWDPTACPTRPVFDFPEYDVFIGEFDPAADSVTFGLNEPNDAAATAETLKYGKDAMSGEYFLSVVHGMFDSGTDVDVYKLTFPTDDPTPLDPTQEWNLNFDLFPAGITGNGSTVQTGNVWLTTEADPITKIGQVDGTKIDVAFGLTLSPDNVVPGSSYLLFIEVANGQMPGSNGFYFLTHNFGGGNPIEAADVTNSLIATPEPLTASMLTNGMGYFVAGNLDVITDVDHYIIDNLANAGDNIFVTCAGQRLGSGLRGLKFDVTDTTGATNLFTATETADDNANTGDPSPAAPDPGTYPQLVVKVSAMTQAPGIIGTNYNCGMGFTPPQ